MPPSPVLQSPTRSPLAPARLNTRAASSPSLASPPPKRPDQKTTPEEVRARSSLPSWPTSLSHFSLFLLSKSQMRSRPVNRHPDDNESYVSSLSGDSTRSRRSALFGGEVDSPVRLVRRGGALDTFKLPVFDRLAARTMCAAEALSRGVPLYDVVPDYSVCRLLNTLGRTKRVQAEWLLNGLLTFAAAQFPKTAFISNLDEDWFSQVRPLLCPSPFFGTSSLQPTHSSPLSPFPSGWWSLHHSPVRRFQ